jgi:hypothetical protein
MALPASRMSQVLRASQTFTIAVPWQVFANTGQGGAGTGTATYSITTPATTGDFAAYYELLDCLDRMVLDGRATVS